MRRYAVAAVAIGLAFAGDGPAFAQSRFRPTAVLRSADEFVVLSSETTAILYDRDHGRLRTFVVPFPISGLELSADEKLIRIGLVEGADACFDVRSGEPVGPTTFVAAGPPAGGRYRTNASPARSLVGRLIVTEVETGRTVRTLDEVRYIGPERWCEDGTADVAVGVTRAGEVGLAAYRFSPASGELRELFWLPEKFSLAGYMAFDVDRGYGVITTDKYETSVVDLRTGVSSTVTALRGIPSTPLPAVPAPAASGSWLTPGTAVVALAGMLGIGILLLSGGQVIWLFVRRRMDCGVGETPEAADYGQLPGDS